MKILVSFLSALVLAATLSGCTYRLWQTDQFTSYRYPSPDPKLVVLHDPKRDDFIACYDELSDKRGTIERRAYRVRENGDVTERGKRPVYVSPIPTNLVALPINPPATTPPYVTLSNAQFTIIATNAIIGPTMLPTYCERTGLPTKIALTPLAVTADVAVVGVVVAVLCPGLWTGVASGD